ncbi:hypothetical protein D1157_05890 [Anaerotruncus sp. X29]|jgi:hypothetical protein|nr:hypothetical protein [Anaerotruncus sp.]NCE74534.1 hypothetical protein [Anaerotruncus sp. X29]
MTDLLLDRSGDLQISADGDLSLTNSTAQAIQLRLRWFLSEWKFGPEYGLPYYEEILVKNASTLRAKQLIREQIMSVDGVQDVTELLATADPAKRTMLVRYTAVTDAGQIREEERFDV